MPVNERVMIFYHSDLFSVELSSGISTVTFKQFIFMDSCPPCFIVSFYCLTLEPEPRVAP